MDYKALSLQYEQEVIALRRELHQRAELSFQEVETTGFIADQLTRWGIPFRRTQPTGLVADLRGEAGEGPVVALRADIDALPICEPEGLLFRSKNEGVMHACGHDTHASMLLCAGHILWENRNEWAGTIRLIFQPGEETGQGAEKMIDQGALEGVTAIFGIHAVPMEPVGRISVASGPIQASNDAFSITVTGQACHGAAPEEGKDATVAAAAVVMALQSVASRRVAPLQPLCITVGQLHSGTRYNIVSGKAVMDGTIRCFSQQLREEMPELLQSVAGSTAAAYGCSAQVSVTYSADVLCCDEELTQVATQAAQETAPEVCPLEKKMVSEDFASYTRHVPGSFVTLGIGGGAPLHNERMTVDESALKTGVAMHLAMAMRLLERR